MRWVDTQATDTANARELAKAMAGVHGGRPVTCKQVDHDSRYNRPVAQCFAGDDDLQVMMVSVGWAWSFGRFSERYAPEEKEAATRRAGVHAHRCLPPWEWRAQQRLKSEGAGGT